MSKKYSQGFGGLLHGFHGTDELSHHILDNDYAKGLDGLSDEELYERIRRMESETRRDNRVNYILGASAIALGTGAIGSYECMDNPIATGVMATLGAIAGISLYFRMIPSAERAAECHYCSELAKKRKA